MSFRITTNGVFRNYQTNLHSNQVKLNDAMTRVETGRAFNSYAEDPATASRAFQLRRSFWRTGDQIDNSNYVISKFSTGFDALDPVVDGNGETPDLDSIESALRAVNGTAGNARKTLGIQMQSLADSVMRVMNTQYGDEFIFAGADGLNVPFDWKENSDGTKTLLYRGVDVDAFDPSSQESQDVFRQENGLAAGDPVDADAYQKWYVDKYCGGIDAPAGATAEEKDALYQKAYDKAALRFDEATYVDIGLGMKADENYQTIPSSAYNSALNGLNFLGYGVDEDGDSKNLVVLMNELGDIYARCDTDSGAYASAADEDRAVVLTEKLMHAIDRTQEQHVKLSSEVNYLKTNLEQLQDSKLTLNEQIETIEQADPAEAIMSMMWAQYCYNASLRIGNQVLSQSLIDYLN